ncbi:Mth938-like domain-containing protein [Chloroflexota bacterium]
MNIIDSYHFGEIVIDGKKYSSDVVIFPDRVRDSWWRKTGHELCLEDIAEVIDENPEVLLVGTGVSGLMKVLPEVKQEAKARHIQFIVEPTSKACDIYNRLSHSRKVVATLHLTC